MTDPYLLDDYAAHLPGAADPDGRSRCRTCHRERERTRSARDRGMAA